MDLDDKSTRDRKMENRIDPRSRPSLLRCWNFSSECWCSNFGWRNTTKTWHLRIHSENNSRQFDLAVRLKDNGFDEFWIYSLYSTFCIILQDLDDLFITNIIYDYHSKISETDDQVATKYALCGVNNAFDNFVITLCNNKNIVFRFNGFPAEQNRIEKIS